MTFDDTLNAALDISHDCAIIATKVLFPLTSWFELEGGWALYAIEGEGFELDEL